MTKAKIVRAMAQVVEYLPSKQEALRLNPNTAKNKNHNLKFQERLSFRDLF
jgi:hypothetical protein